MMLKMVVFLMSALWGAQSVKTLEPSIPTLTVCELLSRRLEYDGKFVRVLAQVSGNDEGAWFLGDDCPALITTEAHVWPSAISMGVASPEMNPANRIHSINFVSDQASYNKLTPKLRKIGRHAPDECIIWTFTGLFETRKDYPKISYPNGSSMYIGFGANSSSPAQLLWKTADDVNIAPNCHPKGSNKK